MDAVEQAKETVEQAKDKVREVGSRDREKKSLPRRLFVPLAASAVSGATAYAARKAPGFFQEKVVPKLKELASNGGTLEKAKQAVEGAVPGVGDGAGGQRERPRRKVSDQQRAKQQRERAARRRERREALTK